MVERKPSNLGFESWIDRQIREATERGEFDGLAGKGEPIPGAGTSVDESWWLNDYLRREGLSSDVMLPPSLLLRRDIERLPQGVRELASESRVREVVAELNERIVRWLRMPEGPIVPIRPIDVDKVVAQWREARAAPTTEPAAPSVPAQRAEPERVSWWRRLRGGR
ncbi:DUF1992 domain-containing protein [Nocardia uniformis]|uniref:DUF1992 domain-containing protein n=1 Tax=Nocardia uniformis TaxID=53432 RepID=A0A849CI93_9NOCA|nr:DUF1992 domain-containing protein [Nocardia uniformis]NNH75949.1 DUF1992 domain-containing protein [Nocardia uniformis]